MRLFAGSVRDAGRVENSMVTDTQVVGSFMIMLFGRTRNTAR